MGKVQSFLLLKQNLNLFSERKGKFREGAVSSAFLLQPPSQCIHIPRLRLPRTSHFFLPEPQILCSTFRQGHPLASLDLSLPMGNCCPTPASCHHLSRPTGRLLTISQRSSYARGWGPCGPTHTLHSRTMGPAKMQPMTELRKERECCLWVFDTRKYYFIAKTTNNKKSQAGPATLAKM